jgi:Uma2 family endonuclease
VLAPRSDFYASRLPEPRDVWLLIEVADTSLLYDRRTKFPLYARAGVAEAWLANVDGRSLEIHRSPRSARYQNVRVPTATETFSAAAFPDLRLTLRDVFG